MPTSSILLIGNDSIWEKALSNLVFVSGANLGLVTSQATGMRELLREIELKKISVVLVGESIPLAGKDSLTQLLMIFPKLRIVVVSEDNNWVHIFQKEDFLLTSLTDLLNVINPD